MGTILRPQLRLISDSMQVPANRYLSTCLIHSIHTPFKITLLVLKSAQSKSLDFTLQFRLNFNFNRPDVKADAPKDSQGF